ncbi:MAG: sigma-54 interaction domain-containing protein [Bacillota bacterium]
MEFVTRNPEMQKLLSQARKAAGSEHTVLLQGESGTGKERLARYIHLNSGRRNGPFVKVDCTTVPEQLWESELFGYARGAFTGANREGKPGKFDLAAGGSIFLDEIGEVPLSIQVKLLRVLQDKAYDPIGATETRRADVRIIAATNRDLALLKEKGQFREDLYYRLNVLGLTLPPLRERREDLELLTQEILARHVGPGKPVPKLTAEVMAAILLYDWPGNVRELENALYRAVLLAEPDGPIELAHLPPEVAGKLQPSPRQPVLRRYVRSAELLLIRWALSACDGDRTKAARFLGISRAALYKKLKLYPEFQTGLPGDAS